MQWWLAMAMACDSGTDSTAGAPAITLVSPQDGAVVCGTPLVVVAEIENFRLTNKTIEDAPPDLGHMHVYLNGQEVAQADEETVIVNDVADALYQLKIDISHADHSALDPYVGDLAYVTVDSSVCEP
jgi:hypothetical protein